MPSPYASVPPTAPCTRQCSTARNSARAPSKRPTRESASSTATSCLTSSSQSESSSPMPTTRTSPSRCPVSADCRTRSIAVYRHMLPQPRLRFVLADDPGAGKTIMAGLLLKELRLRMVADRVPDPVPSTADGPVAGRAVRQVRRAFRRSSTPTRSSGSSGRPRGRERPLASPRSTSPSATRCSRDLLRSDWDLVIVDEAHKCSAASRYDAVEGRERLDRTKRYTLAEELSRRCERLLLMTATPHSGDRSRFHNFLRLLDPDQFAVDQLAAEQITLTTLRTSSAGRRRLLKDEHGNDLFVPRDVLTQPFEPRARRAAPVRRGHRVRQDFLGSARTGRRGNGRRARAHRAAAPSCVQPRRDPLLLAQARRADRRAPR